jgi:cytochrome oxidase Cu insertion factor (SCO1/SenC/PrrC family)
MRIPATPARGRKPVRGGTPAPGPGTPARASRRRTTLLAGAAGALAGIIIAAAVVISGRLGTGTSSLPRPSGIPANISTSLASLMQLSPLPAARAPSFTLTDQHGRTLPLASLRGKVVVLEFMDPHCTDICPIVSEEFLQAYHDLGSLAGRVVFAAVNVNPYVHSVRAVAAFSAEHQLTAIPGWRFFTGPVPALRAVWRDYQIAVAAPHPNGDILHTSAIYFIDARGRERYLASPMVNHTRTGAAYLPASRIAAWGHGLALLAADLAR